MTGNRPGLSGKAIMIVEDEYLIAMNLEMALADLGASIIGPYARVEAALAAIEADDHLPDAAVLDINVRNRPVFPVAERLSERGIPFVFATGYDKWTIPGAFSQVRRFEKPTDPAVVAHAVAELIGTRNNWGVA